MIYIRSCLAGRIKCLYPSHFYMPVANLWKNMAGNAGNVVLGKKAWKGLYRPNVAGLLVREDGKLLVCERSRQKGAWQFPQGGIDPGETATEAVKREVREEVGFLPSQYDVVESPGAAIVTIIRRRCWSMSAKSGSSLLWGRSRSISCAGCVRTLRSPAWTTGSSAPTGG